MLLITASRFSRLSPRVTADRAGVLALRDERAPVPHHGDAALGGQHAHRTGGSRAADVVLRAKLGGRGQLLAWQPFARVQSGPQGVGYGLVRDLRCSRHTSASPANDLGATGLSGPFDMLGLYALSSLF